jgi:hypothetical protein
VPRLVRIDAGGVKEAGWLFGLRSFVASARGKINMEQPRRFKRATIPPEKLDERLKANLRSLEIVNEDLTELLDNYYLPPGALDAAY